MLYIAWDCFWDEQFGDESRCSANRKKTLSNLSRAWYDSLKEEKEKKEVLR